MPEDRKIKVTPTTEIPEWAQVHADIPATRDEDAGVDQKEENEKADTAATNPPAAKPDQNWWGGGSKK